MTDRWENLRRFAAAPVFDNAFRRAEVADLLAERDRLAAEVERLLDLVDAVEDDLGPDYLTALTEEADRG